jgi:hypothetical protein
MKFIINLILFYAIFFQDIILANSASLENGLEIINLSNDQIDIIENKVFINEYKSNLPLLIKIPLDNNIKKCFLNQKMACSPGEIYPIEPLNLINTRSHSVQISYHYKNNKKNITIHQLPKDLPRIKIKGEASLDKDFIFSWHPIDTLKIKYKNIPTYLFILSPKGDIKFIKKFPFPIIDFRPHRISSKLYFSYLRIISFNERINIEGKRVLLNNKMNFVKEFPELLDFRDFHLINENWYISTQYSEKFTKLNVRYVQQSIVEYKNEQKIYEWNLDDLSPYKLFPLFIAHGTYHGDKAIHQYHLNAFNIIGDNLLISFEAENIMLINKKSKKIKWILGGLDDQFKIPQSINFGPHQSPTFNINDSSLTLFDNSISLKQSRVLKYTLDFKNKELNKFEIIKDKIGYSAKMGFVMVNEPFYTITHGLGETGDVDIMETEKHKTTWSLTFDWPRRGVYRAYRELVPR